MLARDLPRDGTTGLLVSISEYDHGRDTPPKRRELPWGDPCLRLLYRDGREAPAEIAARLAGYQGRG